VSDAETAAIPVRFRNLPWTEVAGHHVPVAARPIVRLLGLALLDRDRSGPGLLIPRCHSVHTFGMRFALDIAFLDSAGEVISCRRAVPPARVAAGRGAASVLEVPA
jgi:uncharacterized protein